MLRGNVLGGMFNHEVTCGKGRIPWISWGGCPALTFESLLWGSKRGELLRGSPLLLLIIEQDRWARVALQGRPRPSVLFYLSFAYAHFVQFAFHAL